MQSLGLPGPELQWKAPQCIVISRTDFLHIDNILWIDSLYLRRRPSAWYPFRFISTHAGAALYAINMMLQCSGWASMMLPSTRQLSRVTLGRRRSFKVWRPTLPAVATAAAGVVHALPSCASAVLPRVFNLNLNPAMPSQIIAFL